MTQEFLSLLKELKVPLLTKEEVAVLQELEKEWRHWKAREQQFMPLRIAEEQEATFNLFLENPTPENELRLLAVADPILTGTRYGILRKAFLAIRNRISDRAVAILRPVMDRIHKALDTHHEHLLQTAEPVLSSRKNNPIVKAARRAIDDADKLGMHIRFMPGRYDDYSPLQLAGVLLSNTSASEK